MKILKILIFSIIILIIIAGYHIYTQNQLKVPNSIVQNAITSKFPIEYSYPLGKIKLFNPKVYFENNKLVIETEYLNDALNEKISGIMIFTTDIRYDTTNSNLYLENFQIEKLTKENKEKVWDTILNYRNQIEDYFRQLGLTLKLYEEEGYCYLQQIEDDETNNLLKLISKTQLSLHLSLLLVTLRKYMLESTANGDEKIVISKEEIFIKMKNYLKETSNEIKQEKEITTYIKKVEEMKFIRKLKNSDDKYEILRLLASFVDAQWLDDLNKHILEYKEHIEKGGGIEDEEGI
mgnify:CR=1 FL=1